MYQAADMAAIMREHPRLVRPKAIRSPLLTARCATPGDAGFILSLRRDPVKARFISPTPDDIEAQRDWIASDPDIYLVFETDRPIGTARLYEPRGMGHTWGSWILTPDRPSGSALHSALMVYLLSSELGFNFASFSIKKPNEQCWAFLETLGAKLVGETDDSFLYQQDYVATERAIEKTGIAITIDW